MLNHSCEHAEILYLQSLLQLSTVLGKVLIRYFGAGVWRPAELQKLGRGIAHAIRQEWKCNIANELIQASLGNLNRTSSFLSDTEISGEN